jgi:NADH-quinone oxidoreductase subunit L
MSWIVKNLWLISVLPLLAAAILSVTKKGHRRFAAGVTIITMGFSFLLALCALAHEVVISGPGTTSRQFVNFDWFQFGEATLRLGWVLDPLTAVMLAMVTLVGLLIFIFSVGYMAHDDNFTRFFCFLSLFAAAMLGLIIANNLLLLFVCWELVGLASYLLIGFWYHKPSAAAAAKKAFITTRIGDVFFFLGILYLYSQAGTLLFYDVGNGCMEQTALSALVGRTTFCGMAVSTGIGLLIFCGAIGKSGQVPLHVWLPDAMEGPTPVSALIHAATMVAAGVFLIARVYPLMVAHATGTPAETTALEVVTWIGSITAVFAASIAVAQTDIKRILAYSTVSQLGFMFMGLGMGGIAVGMFHLITHAFFKALLFLGAGSVIHGCHEEQDIRRMGGLRKLMPVTFATYAVGMMALSGVPIVFSGFWSKDEILHAARSWQISPLPFYLGIIGALLTAFYMTRQMYYVFAGKNRGRHGNGIHESPPVMTFPLVVLAVFAVGLGILGTPVWPWFRSFIEGKPAPFGFDELAKPEIIFTLLGSSAIVFIGIFLGWWLYGRTLIESANEPDALQRMGEKTFFLKDVFRWLQNKYYVDELYEATIIRFNAWWAWLCDAMDRWVWNGLVLLAGYVVVGLSWVNRFIDENVINRGFDEGCRDVGFGGRLLSRLQNGQVQSYLRVIGVALALLLLLLMWGCGAS